MSIRVITFVLIGLAAVIGGIFFALRTASHPAENMHIPAKRDLYKPWIEVIRPHVAAYEETGKSHVLRNGDEVELGKMIETDAGGLATIHFPDGSVLRLDSATRVTLEQAEFNPESERLIAKIFLASGQVWSKVLILVTPDSLWEVRTSNAVATVRGTAFGMTMREGRTSVIGSEHSVSVRPVDPLTHQTLSSEAVVTPDTFVDINEKDIPLINEGTLSLAAKKVTDEILADPWVKSAKEQDTQYDQQIEELHGKGLEDKSLREEFREKIREQFEKGISPEGSDAGASPDTKTMPEQREEKANLLPEQKERTDAEEKQTSNKAIRKKNRSIGLASASAPQPPVLTIRPQGNLKGVVEGDRVRFKAVLALPDGKTRIVTADAQWSVLGSIGKMASPGVFLAKLGSDVSEFGTAPGAVIAIWKDPKSGEEILGKSAIFNVEAKIETDINTDG
ncbi:MAG: hypothetical protein G01um101429_964 [Parcubacteria group bacterium Gr01-1014_29]|nr:MAG: hypothetical protein G01um101429_964 [Parcubacteria group bacterium Gr01-1014_29]